MRTDVKIALVGALVLILLVIIYVAFVRAPNRAVRQNTAASSAPPLVQSNNPTPTLPGINSVGGAAAVPATSPAESTASASMPAPATSSASQPTAMADNTAGASLSNTPAASQSLSGSAATAAADTSVADSSLNSSGDGDADAGNSGSGASGNSAMVPAVVGNSSGGGASNFVPSIAPTQNVSQPSRGLSGRYYHVRSGDTLIGIARQVYGNPRMVTSIEAANPGVSARDLRIGERLRLPRKSRHMHARRRSVRHHHAAHTGGRIYVVRRGDDLEAIARRFYHRSSDWKRIYAANRSRIGNNPAHIFVGERLVIPAR